MRRLSTVAWLLVAFLALTVGLVCGARVMEGVAAHESKVLNVTIAELKAQRDEARAELESSRVMLHLWTGVASFYGSESGRVTSTGESFDGTSWTAAHRTLPAGTLLIVEALETGRWAVVRVNDFGPARRLKDREIDLSRRVAEHLGIIHQGLAKVRIYQIELRPRPSEED